MQKLPIPPKKALLYEDERLYVCFASFPITKGHTIVVWKGDTGDIHLLSRDDYEYLMDVVNIVRNVLLEKFNVEKVYLMYMDEVKQVHWHLVPRYDELGFNIFLHTPIKVSNFFHIKEIKKDLQYKIKNVNNK